MTNACSQKFRCDNFCVIQNDKSQSKVSKNKLYFMSSYGDFLDYLSSTISICLIAQLTITSVYRIPF